ncbi:MAG: histidine--tRNA ligase [Verrucomicrobiae bacterium]|nr:histidine--tRNA ligase [Verrucomicrobiae bacterium]
MDLAPLPGFRDFFPDRAARREYLFARWRETARRFGFEPYDGPPLESVELYRRKSGEEIVGQLYAFTDKGGREVALRPEMTPTLARMIGTQGASQPKPIKWFSMPQLFRYERQQRGRLREHFQFNCDILGEASIEADVELVALLVETLASFGLTARDFSVKVSDRLLLVAVLEALGIADGAARAQVFAAVDKLSREPREKVREKLVASGLAARTTDDLLELLAAHDLSRLASRFETAPQVAERVLTLQRFFGLLECMGLGGFAEFDPTIVRGLDYYTGIVFEAFDREGKLRAISGGGRYDDLLENLGGTPLPALGFGMGDVVLGEMLTERNLWPAKPEGGLQIYLVLVEEALRPKMLALGHTLRRAGFRVDYSLATLAVGKQFRAAAQRHAAVAIVLGPEEWLRGAVKLKDLASREEREVSVAELEKALASLPS